jgi:hypothetical protein
LAEIAGEVDGGAVLAEGGAKTDALDTRLLLFLKRDINPDLLPWEPADTDGWEGVWRDMRLAFSLSASVAIAEGLNLSLLLDWDLASGDDITAGW